MEKRNAQVRILRSIYVDFEDVPNIRGIIYNGYILINTCSREATGRYIMYEDMM